jgi:hypothetical protein
MSRHAYLAAAALVAAAGVSIGLAGMSAATDSGAVAPTLANVKTSAPASFVPIDEEKAGLEMAQAQSRFLPVFDRAARTAGFGGAYFNGATPHLNVASGVNEEARPRTHRRTHVTPSRSRHPFALTSHALAGDVSGKG